MIKNRWIKWIGISIILGVIAAGFVYQTIFGLNTKHTEDVIFFIPGESTFDQVTESLITQHILRDESSFRKVAKWMKYEDHVKPGRYILTPQLSNRTLIALLRSGRQTPVRVTFSTARTIADIAGVAGRYLEPDSLSFLTDIASLHERLGSPWTAENAIALFIPNTYEMYWTTSPQEFLNRMKKEFDRFWSSEGRLDRLAALGLTQQEVTTLASIVERESQKNQERPIIAGVYLNRLKQGMKLDADPTVVFAVGDFTIRRVLYKHLAYDSPYNTYMYPGIPPGPICMPSISSIDAVLDAEKHDYIYFCAKPGYEGLHSFASNDIDHARNARVYQRWLSSEGIFK